ncbi:MAG: hypothetical protein E6J02_02050 [Chloroflexi bacterium]|nr:MAG: hypothetical protein E6J02_02050 [Chloroflexota bacterium]TME19056.1 MAG: hypothetical protein E6I70_05210 [Chloroflexota bacterium]
MDAPRVWRWVSTAGGLVLLLAGLLGLTQVLTAPGGSAQVAWLGAWRSLAGAAVLIGVWWMGSRRRAAGGLVLAFGLSEIVVDLFFGDLRGWAVLLLAGGLLATIGGLWTVTGSRFGALGGILAGVLLAACLVASVVGGSGLGEVALLTASAFLMAVAVRLLWQPCLAPGFGLTLTALGVVALAWLGVLALLGLAQGWTLDQLRSLAAWPLTLAGTWILLTSFLRLRSRTTPPGWNPLGLAAGAAVMGTGIGMLLLGASGMGLALVPAAALVLTAAWALWFGGWQWRHSGEPAVGT